MFKNRTYQMEIMDEDNIPKDLLYQNLKELEFINKYLGGHDVSIYGLKKVTTDKTKTYSIMDIGCGGGDSLKAIAKWSLKKGYNLKLNGVDLKEDCINYAKINCSYFERINFCCGDFRKAFSMQESIDIVHASLFCHHFYETEIIEFVKLCSQNKVIFVINDLERNSFAYYSIKWLTKFLSKSQLVKNDAPLSVLRGFKKTEWIEMLKRSGIKKYTVNNRWAFRHLVIAYPND